MKKAIYPGSFDPLTYGHLDIILRAKNICDELTILIANSKGKNYLFSLNERKAQVLESIKDYTNIRVESFDGLTVNYAKLNEINFIVRGVRGAADLEYEMAMASINKKLNSTIETVILPADPEYCFIASRSVKEVAFYKGQLTKLVPPHIEQAIKNKFNAGE